MTENLYLAHHGVKGMKWGIRRTPEQLGYNDSDTKITKSIKKDYNAMSKQEFRQKHHVSKRTYARRVEKSETGDPFRDRRAKMQKSALGRKMFDVNAKAESEVAVSRQLADKAKKVGESRSTASKAVAAAFLGEHANTSYNTLRASGSTKRGAAAVTALLGSRGGIEYANRKYRGSSQGRRTYNRSMNRYYEE